MKTKMIMALLAGATLFAACKGSGNYKAMDSLQREAVDSPKLVKTADMRFKVKNVLQSAEQISKLTTECGGTVMHHNMQSVIVGTQDIQMANDSVKKLTVYHTNADITIKIPSEVIEPFMDSLNHLGVFVENRKMEIEDRTLDYLSQKMKADNRKQSVALRGKIKLTSKGADSILTLKDDVVDRKISNLRTNEAVKYSTLILNLYQNNSVTREVVLSDDLSTYNSSLMVRTGLALAKGWYFFSEMIVILLHLWVFLFIGGGVWLGIYLYRRKKRLTDEAGA